MKVLFIGNSHTYVHYVPLRVTEFCRSHGASERTGEAVAGSKNDRYGYSSQAD